MSPRYIRHTPTLRSGAKAIGVFALLAGVQSGLVDGLPAALAQPVAPKTLDAAKLLPLSEADKAAIAKAIGLVKQEQLCQTPLALKVKDATVEEIAAQIKEVLKTKTIIEVRGAGPARFTLDLANMTVGQLLQPVANLAGCRLYLLSDRLLIAPEKELTEAERTERTDWAKTPDGGGNGEPPVSLRANQALVEAIVSAFEAGATANRKKDGAPDANAANTQRVGFGDLDPDLQKAVQQWVDNVKSGMQRPTKRLTPQATVSVTSDAEKIQLAVKEDASSFPTVTIMGRQQTP